MARVERKQDGKNRGSCFLRRHSVVHILRNDNLNTTSDIDREPRSHTESSGGSRDDRVRRESSFLHGDEDPSCCWIVLYVPYRSSLVRPKVVGKGLGP